MANRTVNRTPSFINTSALDEKYSNFSTFKGICDNKNYLGIDQTTFEDANNMYIDQDAQLSSRPSIRTVDFTYANEFVVKVYKINNLCVYHTLDRDNNVYYIHFKFNKTWYSRPVTKNINIAWWDTRYVIFTETSIEGFSYDYLNKTVTWYDTEACVYVPITKLRSEVTTTSNESPNVLTDKQIIRYIFRPDSLISVVELIGKDVIVEVDGIKYEITFLTNNEKVFVKAIGIFDAVEFQYSILGNCLAFNSNGDMYYSIDSTLFYPINRPAGIKPFISNDGLCLYGINTPNDSSIGKIYKMSLSVISPSGIPQLYWEETSVFIDTGIKYDLCHWASKVGQADGNGNYIRNMSSMQFTQLHFENKDSSNGTSTYGFETFGSSNGEGHAVFIASFVATANCVNNRGRGYMDTIGTPAYWGGNDGTSITLYGRLFILLLDGVVTVDLIDYNTSRLIVKKNLPTGKVRFTPVTSRTGTQLYAICLTKSGSVLITPPNVYGQGIAFDGVIILRNTYTGLVPLGNFSYTDETGAKGLYYILYKNLLRPSFDLSFRIRTGSITDTNYANDIFDLQSVFSEVDKIHTVKLAYNEENGLTSIFRDVIKSAQGYYELSSTYSREYYDRRNDYNIYSSDDIPERETGVQVMLMKSSGLTNNYTDNMTLQYHSIANRFSKFKLGETGCLTNQYYRIQKQNIPLFGATDVEAHQYLPTYCSDNRIIYYNVHNDNIYDNLSWSEIYVDHQTGENYNIFSPYVIGTFVTNVVSNNNKVLISSPREGKVYLPENDVLSFSNEITNLVTFNQTSLGIFSENEVHELQYDEGMYRLSLTKLQLGCKKDSDVLLNYDGKTIFLTTLKGLNALNYQDFVQSTEYVYNYLTENIMSMYDTYAKSPLKLYQFKNWVFMYRQDVNYLFLFDLRNASWWKWTNIANVQQIIFDNEDLILLINGVLYKYSFENISGENYVDDVGQTINWMFRSQKLHFNAPNNYKHVKSVSIITSQTEETTMRYKMEFRNYRDLSNIMEVDVFERDVDLLTTIIKKVNFIKTNAFQFSVMNDVKNPLPRKFVTPNIAIKYRITERLR